MAISSKGKLYAQGRARGLAQGESAREAGYAHPEFACSRLEANEFIQEYIQELTKEISSSRIATIKERQEFWTSILRGDNVDIDGDGIDAPARMNDRLKASELLGKSQMDFVEKKVVEFTNPADELTRLKNIALSVEKKVIPTVEHVDSGHAE